ncbi:SPFH domain-containing protein [Acholeplasma laidlawii]|uniref:SPFH domain-containing protein n=1 Tax=Acholeplasma laidlawii TaxID=2148 RepID=UPI00084C7E02|nr:SPFH domain-containing protein [Acholeplasma laidlawii]NWH09884.1 SPFH domain-containing protein [Acholeplasma laidlawii]OED27138.1 virion core protein (lumpy skin disease virus) [Acholeplasma laidlawii]OWU87011.1 virion core protein (lumpy skin disease virus) [Acholeplasma laidlawii]
MGILNRKKKSGFSDVIRCDQSNYLVWKWHPSGTSQGEVKRETAIRTNSVLRVKTGEVAAFFYKQEDGTKVDYIVGPYDGTLKTKNFPILSSIIGLWYEGDTPFQAEVFFLNLAEAIQVRFGIPYFDVVDSRFPDFQVPVAVRGSLTFKIKDYKRFVLFHQLANFSIEELKSKINASVSRYVKEVVTNAPSKHDIPVIAIESKIDLINQDVELYVGDRLDDLFAISVTGIDLSAVEVDKDNEAYIELKRVTKDISTGKAETDLLNYQEELRIKREEEQYAQRMTTRQTNIGAYQTQISGEVGVAGAEALGKMVENGAGNVDLGGHGTAFNPVSMMAGIAVGSAVGKNIAGVMDQSLDHKNNGQSTPPSVPVTQFHVAKDGKPTGPFDINNLRTMVATGALTSDSLVWKEGMSEWQKASSQIELAGLFPPKL